MAVEAPWHVSGDIHPPVSSTPLWWPDPVIQFATRKGGMVPSGSSERDRS